MGFRRFCAVFFKGFRDVEREEVVTDEEEGDVEEDDWAERRSKAFGEERDASVE